MGVDEGDLQVVLSMDKMYNVDAIYWKINQ